MTTHRPRKRFGQNFLHDRQVIDQIISIIDIKSADHIVEIGPGKGALTEFLLSQCARLDVIELDRDLVALLEHKFADAGTLQIHCADALNINFAELSDFENKARIVGNLPYNISTPLMFHLLRYRDKIDDMHFMLQKEVVNRICAAPGSKTYGRLSVMVQYHCQPQKILDVGAECFTPRPKVDSAVVRLTPHIDTDHPVRNSEIFESLVLQAFSQRRKTIRNSLRRLLSEQEIGSISIDPNCRAENLTILQFVHLANLYETKASNQTS